MANWVPTVIDGGSNEDAGAPEGAATPFDLREETSDAILRRMDREQIADMVSASEARTETSLARAMGEIRVEFEGLRGDIRELKASSASKGTVVLTGLSLFAGIGAILAAFLAFGSQWFGLGLDYSAAAQQAADRAVAAYAQAHPETSLAVRK